MFTWKIYWINLYANLKINGIIITWRYYQYLDFMGINIDIERVFIDNMKKENVVRKNNTVINSGDNPTKEVRAQRIKENQKIYGLTPE